MHNREDERAVLKRKLAGGASIHMPAPRRIGKTWTVAKLATDLRRDGWHVIEIDVEGLRTPNEFARELCVRIEAQNSVKERFKTQALQRVNNLLGGSWGERPLDALGRVDPIEFSELLIASLNESGGHIAIIVDEISYFFLAMAVRDKEEARSFAYKLRSFLQRYKNVRWLITGSIGLSTIARRFEIEGAFVDFETFTLSPFTCEQARSYMRDPKTRAQFSYDFDASDEDFDAMFAELGWLAPYYLRMIANEVRPSIGSIAGRSALATSADFEAAFSKLLQPNRRSEFAVWREHVSKNLPAVDRAIAECVLDFLSNSLPGADADTLLAVAAQSHGSVTKRQIIDVLAMLTNDGLTEKVGVRYTFRSGLVRRYWQEYEAN